ncbi:hypothetical protein Mgra_00007766 [Meloidogyne graminicola]|uniref:Uncharacterized protein n=1 Tax=Meloidogyne graminicola TaxID=189291 RepID=A0A8S9ZHQ9_9BILA|nr:hypothetical protein Mgra_00007766 [Meloidogyne graminicola]
MTFHPENSFISPYFVPKIYCLQLLFERISSPWESNFEGIKFIYVRFLPSTNCSTSFNPQRQIRVGSGHLFFIRENNQGEGPGENLNCTDKKMRKSLKKIRSFVCPLKQDNNDLNNLILEAHFLLNIVEIQRKICEENLIKDNKKIEKGAQTDSKNLIERGIQTTKELLLENSTTKEIPQKIIIQNNKQIQKDKKLIKLLLILLLKTKNEQKIKNNQQQKQSTKSTITECSLPPYSDQLFNRLTKDNQIQIEHFRAQIGYLSSVHRTLVVQQDKKIKKENIKKLIKTTRKEQKIEHEKSPISSGLQSIATTSPKENEKNTINELNLTKISRNKDELILFNKEPKKDTNEIISNKTTKIYLKSPSIKQNIKEKENNKTSTKSSSSSSTKSDENSVNSIIKDKNSVISSQLSSVKNSTSTTKSTSSTSKTQKSSESTENEITSSDNEEKTF